MEEKTSSNKLILVMLPPIVNKFNFDQSGKNFFLDVPDSERKLFKKGNWDNFERSELLESLQEEKCNQEIENFFATNQEKNLILVNYPKSSEQLTSLDALGIKVSDIILINISNYEIISNFGENFFVCPVCERIYPKDKFYQSDESVFHCSKNPDCTFSLKDIELFSDKIIKYYLENTPKIIDFLVKNHNSQLSQIAIDNSEEIATVPEKIFQVLSNL